MNELPELDGYDDPIEYPHSPLRYWPLLIVIAIIGFFIIRFPLLDSFEYVSQYADFSVLFIDGAELITLGLFMVPLFFSQPHEWIHYYIRLSQAKDPSIHDLEWYSLANPHVAISDEFVTRRENIVNLLGPFFVICMISSAIIMARVDPHITLLAAGFFWGNAVGSANDIRGAFDDYRFPKGTMIYYPKQHDHPGYVYKPE